MPERPWRFPLVSRLVLPPDAQRGERRRLEEARIRTGDRLSWLLVLTGLVPLTFQKPLVLPVWALVAALVAMARRRRVEIDEAQTSWLVIAGVLTSGLLMPVLGVLWGFVLWLVFMGAILLIQTGGKADARLIYAIGFVLFLTYALLTMEYYFLIGLIALLIGGTLVLLRMQLPDAVRQGHYRQVLRIVRVPLLAGICCGIPIFILCPRVPVSVLNVQQPPHTAGFSEEIRLGDMRSTLESDRTMMTIRTAPRRRWRGTVLDHYEHGNWKRTRRDYYTRSSAPGEVAWLDRHGSAAPGPGVESAEVILEPTDVRFYFAPAFPIALQNETGNFAFDQAATLQRVEPPQAKRTRYVVWFGDAPASEHPKIIRKIYLQLPADFPARIAAKALEVTRGAKSDSDRARRLETWLQDNFTYTLDTIAPSGRDPIDYFLFDAKSGHCEYFAGAMALMLRTLGIPSRVVVGFGAGQYNEYAGTWTVRERNAHAWVEAYVEASHRWVEFDPTTGRGAPVVEDLATRLGLDRFVVYRMVAGTLQRVDFEWQRSVVSFSAGMQSELLGRIYAAYDALEIALRVRWLKATRRERVLVTTLVVLVALLPLVLSRRVRGLLARILVWVRLTPALAFRLKRRLGTTDPWPKQSRFYGDMLVSLERMGIVKRPSETPWELLRRVRARLGDDAALVAPIATITESFCQLAYRGRAVDANGERRIAEALARVNDAARGSRSTP